jgi:hypothetical protein
MGFTAITGLLTPYIGRIITYFAKDRLTSYAERRIREQLELFIDRYFKTGLVKAVAQFFIQVIKEHWTKIDPKLGVKHVIKTLLDKIFYKGISDYI